MVIHSTCQSVIEQDAEPPMVSAFTVWLCIYLEKKGHYKCAVGFFFKYKVEPGKLKQTHMLTLML